MVVLEAWSHQLPVLMTRACNIPVGFARDAALKIETNPSSIAEGLIKLFQMPKRESKAMGQRGFQLVKDCFSWDRVAQDMLSVYEWCVNDGKRPDCVHLD